jgi:hypothetical protein
MKFPQIKDYAAITRSSFLSFGSTSIVDGYSEFKKPTMLAGDVVPANVGSVLRLVIAGSKTSTFDAANESGAQETGGVSIECTRRSTFRTKNLSHLFIALLLAFLMNSAHARNQENTWTLVCFTQLGLEKVLSEIVNAQQFLRNSMGQTVSKKKMSRAGCDYAQVPVGTVADPTGFFSSQKGFTFPVFRLRFSTTNQEMYSADGIFESESWILVSVKESYFDNQGEVIVRGDRAKRNLFFTQKLVPKNCDILRTFFQQSSNFLPDYMVIPKSCRRSYTTH